MIPRARVLGLALLLGLSGCLDYEIRIETVVAEDGSIHRVVRLRETSKGHETWKAYARAAAPFKITGSDADGFVMEAKLPAGAHASGLRVRDQELKDKTSAPKDALIHEGRFRVVVDDIGIGKLYRYYETLDLGFDLEVARKELDFGLEIGIVTLVHALEMLEGEQDFAPVLTEAKRTLIPEIRAGILAIHSQVSLILQSGILLEGSTRLADLENDSRFRIIVSEFAKLGVTRKIRPNSEATLQGYVGFAVPWRFNETLWKRFLAPLKAENETRARFLRESLYDRLFGDRSKENREVWETAFAAAVADMGSDADEVNERLRKFAASSLGALVTNNFLNDHEIAVSVRLPGVLLRTNGDLMSAPTVRWRLNAWQMDNPRVHAVSFLPSAAMSGENGHGEISNVDALLKLANSMRDGTDEQRQAIIDILKAPELPRMDNPKLPQLKLLRDALGLPPGDE